MKGSDPSEPESIGGSWRRQSSMLDSIPQSEEELEAIRKAVMQKEGLIPMLFELMRRLPRRIVMILKLNDLTRCVSGPLYCIC